MFYFISSSFIQDWSARFLHLSLFFRKGWLLVGSFLCDYFRNLLQQRLAHRRHPLRATTPPSSSTTSPLHERLYTFLTQSYDFRYNLLTEMPEFSVKAQHSIFRPVDTLVFNTLAMEAADAGLGTWSVDLQRLLHSQWIPAYHPLHDYIENLPAWDGQDRLTSLAERVSKLAIWKKAFEVWLRTMVAQWWQYPLTTANALVPLIISRQQGMRKSSFCRMLIPPQLAAYYSEHPQLTQTSNLETQMTKLGLINLDEFDRFSARQMATLKNLLQLPRICQRKAYRQQWNTLHRTASFIATSNEMQVLTDPTGSRRFICLEITQPLDCSPIDHAQLFAQLKHGLQQGKPCFLTHEEEVQLQAHNAIFLKTTPAAEVFWDVFRPLSPSDTASPLSATDIFQLLSRFAPAAMRGQTPSSFGRIVRSLGVMPIRTSRAVCYAVKLRERDSKR